MPIKIHYVIYDVTEEELQNVKDSIAVDELEAIVEPPEGTLKPNEKYTVSAVSRV